jgi:hypothetical protein
MSKISFSAVKPSADAPAVQGEAVAGVPVPSAPVINVASTVVSPAAVAPAAEIPTAPVTALVPVAEVGVPAVSDSPIEFDENDIKFSDVYLPRVNIVQNIGDLMKVFNPGEIVLNSTFVIHTPAQTEKKIAGTPPLKITLIGFKKKQFAEKVSGNVQGLLVNSEAEVARAGGTLAYKEWDQSVQAAKANPAVKPLKYFQALSTALLLIERPADLKDDGNIQFPYTCEGKQYALALWSMKGTAFTNAAKHFFTARKIGHLREGYPTRAWTLTTKLESYGTNMAWIPVVRPAEASTPAFLQFVQEVRGCA